MRGHLQPRGKNRFRAKVYLGRSPDGKRRYLERTVTGTRAEAERELNRMLVEVDEGRHVASAPMTLGDVVDRWLQIKASTVEANTERGYRWVAEHFVKPAFGDRKVASIRTLELDHWYQQLRLSGGARGGPLSGRTVRYCHTVMRQSLEQARKWGLIARNPAVDATPPAARRPEIKPPSVKQVEQLLEAAFGFDPDFGVYLWILAVTGCRRGEACALRWSDVDFERSEIVIARSIAVIGQDRIEKDTKAHQGRRLMVDESTHELLHEFRVRSRARSMRAGMSLMDDAFLFSETADGSMPWRPDVCTNWFGRVRRELGLDHVRLHDIRHFVASALGNAGVPIATVSVRLGHRDKATTLNLYSHSFPAADAAAGAVMGGLLADVASRRPKGGLAAGS
jgi:integrase